jgi:hypothetical protein
VSLSTKYRGLEVIQHTDTTDSTAQTATQHYVPSADNQLSNPMKTPHPVCILSRSFLFCLLIESPYQAARPYPNDPMTSRASESAYQTQEYQPREPNTSLSQIDLQITLAADHSDSYPALYPIMRERPGWRDDPDPSSGVYAFEITFV